ncbi:MAG: hypothetical protein SAMD01599839_22760 [Rectinema sp.]
MGQPQVQERKAMLIQEVQQLKSANVPKAEAFNRLNAQGKKISWPTFLKYYNLEEVPSGKSLKEKYEKRKAFDVEPFKTEIIHCLSANSGNKDLKVSSIYDLLQELFVDTGKFESLPGKEQTLRNYIHSLKDAGMVQCALPPSREMDYVDEETIPFGEQAQMDYGQMTLEGGSVVHFAVLELRRSRFLYVQAQDHPFDAEESANALYNFMVRIGGRFTSLVIDQDRCLVYEAHYGEITPTRVFKDFLLEQSIGLFVCRGSDPETKGFIEDGVKYVKENYFSARIKRGLTVHQAIEGIPKWCDRKNHGLRMPFHKIPSHVLLEEVLHLQPLVPSHYAELSCTYNVNHVDKLGYITYLSNRYSVPKILRNTKVRTRVYGERLFVYERDTDRVITDHVISTQQNKIITKEEHKRKESISWKEYEDKLLAEFACGTMLPFINGVKKENPRYKREQLRAIYDFLARERPSTDFLDKVLAVCVADHCERYHITEFINVYDTMKNDMTKDESITKVQQCIRAKMPMDVETRDCSAYASRVTQLTMKD